MDNELSDDDLLALAIQESEEAYKLEIQRKILEDREIREEQERAFQESLAVDKEKERVKAPEVNIIPKTLDELRQARLKAFNK